MSIFKRWITVLVDNSSEACATEDYIYIRLDFVFDFRKGIAASETLSDSVHVLERRAHVNAEAVWFGWFGLTSVFGLNQNLFRTR